MTQTITDAALALGGALELSILGKATLVLAIGLAAAWMARRARASRRHLVLAATFAALFALPLVAIGAPELAIELPATRAQAEAADDAPAAPPAVVVDAPARDAAGPHPTKSVARQAPAWPTVLRSVWLGGAVLLFLALAVDVWRLGRLRRTALPSLETADLVRSLAAERGVRRSVDMLEHESIAAPLTCGALRPAILLPADALEAGEAGVRRALVHELEHVRRSDWAVQLLARAVCACYWFHPLVWVAWRQLCLEAERAADDAVVQDAERTEYAAQLVALARRMSGGHARRALGMANRSDLAARVSAVLDGTQRRGRAGLATAAAVACAAALLVVTIAPVRTVARPAAPVGALEQEPEAQERQVREKQAAEAEEAAVRERAMRARPTPLDRELYDAAGSGDVASIARLLDAGANVNCAIEGDGSPLIAAAREGRVDAARLLLDRGADPNLAVPGDGTPLIMAARDGHAEAVTLLLDNGAKVDLVVPDDENALIQASGAGHLEIVKLLVSRGADVNTRIWVEHTVMHPEGEWRSPLAMALRGKHAGVAAYLRSVGATE